jgi:hypothetical protein
LPDGTLLSRDPDYRLDLQSDVTVNVALSKPRYFFLFPSNEPGDYKLSSKCTISQFIDDRIGDQTLLSSDVAFFFRGVRLEASQIISELNPGEERIVAMWIFKFRFGETVHHSPVGPTTNVSAVEQQLSRDLGTPVEISRVYCDCPFTNSSLFTSFFTQQMTVHLSPSLHCSFTFHFKDSDQSQTFSFPNGTTIGEIKPVVCPSASPRNVHISDQNREMDDFLAVDSCCDRLFSVIVDEFESYAVENSSSLPRLSLRRTTTTFAAPPNFSRKLTILGRIADEIPVKWTKFAPIKVQDDARCASVIPRLWDDKLEEVDRKPHLMKFIYSDRSWQVKFTADAKVSDAEVFFADHLRLSFPPHIFLCNDQRLSSGLQLCPFSSKVIEIRLLLAPEEIRVRLPDFTEFVTELSPEATVADLSKCVKQKMAVGRLIGHGKLLFDPQKLSDVYVRPSLIIATKYVEKWLEPQTSRSAVRKIQVTFSSDDKQLPLSVTSSTHFGDIFPQLTEWLRCSPEQIIISVEENGRQYVASDEEVIAVHVPRAKFIVLVKPPFGPGSLLARSG